LGFRNTQLSDRSILNKKLSRVNKRVSKAKLNKKESVVANQNEAIVKVRLLLNFYLEKNELNIIKRKEKVCKENEIFWFIGHKV
jgi:hypothetical protein